LQDPQRGVAVHGMDKTVEELMQLWPIVTGDKAVVLLLLTKIVRDNQRYDSDYQALASVVSGENQYFIGNNITTGHCISKYFSQSLVIAHYFRRWETPAE
jgi:hypothetical protein